MAYDYNKYKKTYLGLDDNQKQQWDNKYGNTADYKQFQTDYQNELRNNTVSTPTNTYGDTGGATNATKYTGTGVSGSGDYKYNSSLNTSKIPSNALLFGNNAVQYESQNKGYLENRNNTIANALYNEGKTDEDSVRNYLNNFNDYTNYDKVGQDNTVQAILNRMGSIADQRGTYTTNANSLNSTLSGVASDINNQGQKGYSDLMGGSNYPQDFDEAVRQKLSTAYGISDLNEFRSKYPEQYESLMQALESVRGARDATDPTQRQMLDGYLQGIIGTGVGAGSDTSKLNVLNQTLMDKFEDGNKVSEDMRNIVKLQTEGLTTSEIAKQMGISEDQVQQAILAYNGLDNKLGEYYKLKEGVAKDITEPYDIKMARNDEEKKIALERANRQVEWLTEDFNTTLERQKQQNDINAHNADAIAGRTGLGFSKRGIEGLNYVADQAKQIIDDITKNYDRNNQNLADGIADIIRNWQRNNDDLMKASQDALTNAKNNFTSNMLVVQQKYGTVGLQAQQYLAQNVQGFIEQAEAIYDNALTRQQQNLTNLITNVSNINALEAQNLTMRNAKIQQFQAESMNLNRNQLQSLADQLGMDTSSYQDLVNYQVQAVANQLNGYLAGSGVQFQQEISDLLNQGYTPTQVMQSIMNSQEWKSATANNGEWKVSGNYMYNNVTGDIKQLGSEWGMSNGFLYDKSTGDWIDLNGDEWTKLDDNTLFNKRTGQSKVINGGTDANYVTSQTVDGQTYGVSQNTYNGLVNFYNNHQVGSTGGQCGAFVNDYLQSLGLDRVFVDPIDKKIAAKNTPDGYTGQVGDVIIMDSPSKPENGHVAIIVGVNADGTYTTLESNRKNNDGLVFSRTIDPSKTKVHGYYHPDGVVNQGMSDYDINTATMRLGRMAYGSNISDSESERVEKVLRDGMSMGKSQTEILYDILGMTITKNQDKAEPLINIMLENADENGLKGYDTVGFANLINSGKIDLAVNKVEKAVADKQGIGKDFVDNEASAIAMYDKGNRAIELINNNLNGLGIVAGNWNKQKSKFLKNENFQQLESALTSLVADWRHQMAGSAVTETELKMIDSLIPSVKDNPYNAIQKIQGLQNDVLTRYNSQRGALDLPYVDSTTLKDKGKKAQLYFGGNTGGGGRGIVGDKAIDTSKARTKK